MELTPDGRSRFHEGLVGLLRSQRKARLMPWPPQWVLVKMKCAVKGLFCANPCQNAGPT